MICEHPRKVHSDVATVFLPAEGGNSCLAETALNRRIQRIPGIEIELRTRLPAAWQLVIDGNRYVVTASEAGDSTTTMWSLIRFIGYQNFVSLEKLDNAPFNVFRMRSFTKSGVGFEVEFRLPRDLGDA